MHRTILSTFLILLVVASALATPVQTFAAGPPTWTAYSLTGDISPWGGVIQGADGNMYGTSWAAGTVFSVTSSGKITSLHHLNGGLEGTKPSGLLVQGSDGLLYGTAEFGGTAGCGTVFSLRTDGSGFTVIHTFNHTDGCRPEDGVVEGPDGNLYGTTYTGGSRDLGFIYRLSRVGKSYQILHAFTGVEGANPRSGVIVGVDGRLYGTAWGGGPKGGGSIYALNIDGTGFTVIHAFGATQSDGWSPSGGLIQGRDGLLYGTTDGGGTNNKGTVWKVDSKGNGYTILHSFGSGKDGATPQHRLVQASDGKLYGTTHMGGDGSVGTVFSLSTDGTAYLVLHSFHGQSADGSQTEAGLTQAADGSIWGTASGGGTSNHGVVFKLDAGLPQPAPFVGGCAPVTGVPGSTVYIRGNNFVGATQVAFHGTPALYTVNSAQWIIAKVPVGATTGAISVTNAGGTGTSAGNFQVNADVSKSLPFKFVSTGSFAWPAGPKGPAHTEQGSVALEGHLDGAAGSLTLDLASPSGTLSLTGAIQGTVQRHGSTASVSISLKGTDTLAIRLDNVSLTPQSLGTVGAVTIHVLTGASAGLQVQAQAIVPVVNPKEKDVIPSTTKVVTDAVQHAILLDSGQTVLPINSRDRMWIHFARGTADDSLLLGIAKGDVIVSGPASAAPNGFVLQVVDIFQTPSRISFYTAPATLTDAVTQGSFSGQKTLVGSSLHNAVWKDSAALGRRSDASTSFCINLNATIQSQPSIQGNLNGAFQLQSTGNLCFDISLAVAASWSPLQPNLVSMSVSPSVQLRGQQTIQLAAGAQLDQHVNVWRTALPHIIFPVGPVPVDIVPILNVKVGIQGQIQAAVTLGATESGGVNSTLTCLIDFRDLVSSGCTNQTTSNPAVSLTATGAVQVQGQAYFGPDLWLAVYGLVGPDFGIQAYLQAQFDSSQDPCMQLFAGVQLWMSIHAPPTDITKILDPGEDGTDYFQWIILDLHPIGPTFSWRCTTPYVTATSMPLAEVGAPFSQTLQGFGGKAPYGWSLASGTLPPGLTLGSDGTLSGTPTAAGTYAFTVGIKDGLGGTNTAQFTVKVQGPPVVSTAGLPDAQLNVPYSGSVSATGGSLSYTYSLASGALPPGITLNSDGTITGTPTQSGTYTFAVQAKDTLGVQSAAQTLTLKVGATLAISTDSSQLNAVCLKTFKVTMTAVNGTAPYTWQLLSTQPYWLALTSDGILKNITVIPIDVDPAYDISVKVSDNAGHSVIKNLVLSVDCDRDPPKT